MFASHLPFVRIAILATLAAWTAAAAAVDGLLTRPSAHSVAVTTDRLERGLVAAGFRVFARVDHAAGAASVDLALTPTQLLIFGKPQAGTRLMQSAATIGIDLPLKYLVWQNADGQVTVGWNDPAWLVERHGVADRGAVVQKMRQALDQFASAATRPGD